MSNNYQNMYTNQRNLNNANRGEEKKKRRLDFEPIPFGGEMEGMMISSMDLNALIYDAFSTVFSDFEGCIIVRDAYNNPQVFMYFKDRPKVEGKYKAIEQFRSGVGNTPNSAMNRLIAFNARNQNRYYDLTEDAKELLEPFMIKRHGAKINWNQCFVEKWENNYQSSSIVVELKNLDLVKLIRSIYGSTVKSFDEGGKEIKDRADYSVSIVRPMTPMGFNPTPNSMDVNFLLSIQRLKKGKVQELAAKLGAITTTGGGIVMYRGR